MGTCVNMHTYNLSKSVFILYGKIIYIVIQSQRNHSTLKLKTVKIKQALECCNFDYSWQNFVKDVVEPFFHAKSLNVK